MAMSKKMLMIIAVIAIVAIIAIAAAAAGGNNNAANDNEEEDTMTAENSNLRVVVSDVAGGTQQAAVGVDTFLPLDNGSHFVTVFFNVTNKMSVAGTGPALWWSLYTSDGQIHTITFNAANTTPDGLQAGATASYALPFEVADGATPTKLVYNGVTSLEIPLT
jgi:hypothetical protein